METANILLKQQLEKYEKEKVCKNGFFTMELKLEKLELDNKPFHNCSSFLNFVCCYSATTLKS